MVSSVALVPAAVPSALRPQGPKNKLSYLEQSCVGGSSVGFVALAARMSITGPAARLGTRFEKEKKEKHSPTVVTWQPVVRHLLCCRRL